MNLIEFLWVLTFFFILFDFISTEFFFSRVKTNKKTIKKGENTYTFLERNGLMKHKKIRFFSLFYNLFFTILVIIFLPILKLFGIYFEVLTLVVFGLKLVVIMGNVKTIFRLNEVL